MWVDPQTVHGHGIFEQYEGFQMEMEVVSRWEDLDSFDVVQYSTCMVCQQWVQVQDDNFLRIG